MPRQPAQHWPVGSEYDKKQHDRDDEPWPLAGIKYPKALIQLLACGKVGHAE
jgi:hypothetical protein